MQRVNLWHTLRMRVVPPVLAGWSVVSPIIRREITRRVRSYGLAVALDVLIVTAAFEAATVMRFIDTPAVAVEARTHFLPCLFAGVAYGVIAYLLGLHRRLWRYASLKDGFALMRTVAITTLLIAVLDLAGVQVGLAIPMRSQAHALPLSVVLGGAYLSFLFLGSVKMLPRVVLTRHTAPAAVRTGNVSRVLIVGAGQAGAALAARLLLNSGQGYRIEGFVDDNPAKWGGRIRGLPIFGPVENIPSLTDRLSIDLIAIAFPSADSGRVGDIIAICQQTSARIKILPGLAETVGRQAHTLELREANVADLLGRKIVPLRSPETRDFLRGKTILVTGAAGSIGSELCRQLVTYEPARVIAVDNNETGLFDLAATLRDPDERGRLGICIADITDAESMSGLFAASPPQVVFHAAAYKHVPLLEKHPTQAARVNVLGTYHLSCLASRSGAEVFVFISSDKAAEPVSVLGASKRIGEMLVQAMAESCGSTTRYCAVRFGNVIGSRGSVVPLFTQQIEQGGPVTVTDPAATRYFMTIPEACGLVILTSVIMDAGGLFLLDMGDPVRIADLAERMIRMRGLRVGGDIKIVYTGLRPGERLHEVLAGPEEDLVPTSHHKILRVSQRRATPPLASIEQWMRALDDGLGHEDTSAVREHLFELTREKMSV